MSSDLLLPQVPEAKSEDPEDVSWALSTAEATWARGDHAEGIKWIRRAAEAAAEAEADARALELAKAAAELAALVGRDSRPPSSRTGAADGVASARAPEEVAEPAPPTLSVPSSRPTPDRPAVATPSPTSVTRQVAVPPRSPLAPRAPQMPNPRRPPATPPAVPATTPFAPPVRPVLETIRAFALDEAAASRLLPSDSSEAPTAAPPEPEPGGPGADTGDPTIVGHVSDAAMRRARDSAAEWDLVPTRSLTSEDLDADADADPGARMTMLGQPPPSEVAGSRTLGRNAPTGPPAESGAARGAWAQPKAASSRPASARAALAPHDPALETTQAVRVVVWRDATGVHIAPAGTVVSAITVDAVLVALEPRTDLTAWLTEKER